MDQQKLAEVLKGTIDPNQRQQAEQHLEQVRNRPHVQPIMCITVWRSHVEYNSPMSSFIFYFFLAVLAHLGFSAWLPVNRRMK